jgi:hypothetical protein
VKNKRDSKRPRLRQKIWSCRIEKRRRFLKADLTDLARLKVYHHPVLKAAKVDLSSEPNYISPASSLRAHDSTQQHLFCLAFLDPSSFRRAIFVGKQRTAEGEFLIWRNETTFAQGRRQNNRQHKIGLKAARYLFAMFLLGEVIKTRNGFRGQNMNSTHITRQ